METDNKNNQQANVPPKQKVGDTPVAPWEMPTPEEKAKAEPVRRALQKAVKQVGSPETADEVADRLYRAAGDRKATDLEGGGAPLKESANAVEKQSARPAAPAEKASSVIAETVKQVVAADGREREALAQAAQEVLNPEQQGVSLSGTHQRQLLREAFIRRMKPYDALDARIFLAVNHMPHTRLLNGFFYTLTLAFKGGAAWFALLGLAMVVNRRRGWSLVRQVAPPLALASATVEFPVKTFFRRRRPFITLIQATVIGKKPGSWSFPSGHSAAAFAGAYLLSRQFPRQRWLLFTIAGLVAFSRIYLGDHYPGDVVSGSLSGLVLAKDAAEVQQRVDRLLTTHSQTPG